MSLGSVFVCPLPRCCETTRQAGWSIQVPSQTFSSSPTSWRRTIRYLPTAELPDLLGRVRSLSATFLSGEPSGFDAFRELTDLLLRRTILHPSGGVRLSAGRRPETLVLGGWGGPRDPLHWKAIASGRRVFLPMPNRSRRRPMGVPLRLSALADRPASSVASSDQCWRSRRLGAAGHPVRSHPFPDRSCLVRGGYPPVDRTVRSAARRVERAMETVAG